MSVMQIPTSCYLCESCIDKNAEIEGTKASYICERTGSIIHAYAEGERPRIDAKTGRIPECPLVEEQTHGDWHTGAPTEDGLYAVYYCADGEYEYGFADWNGDFWEEHFSYDSIGCRVIAWHKEEPYQG